MKRQHPKEPSIPKDRIYRFEARLIDTQPCLNPLFEENLKNKISVMKHEYHIFTIRSGHSM
jgi:hypothetical protein